MEMKFKPYSDYTRITIQDTSNDKLHVDTSKYFKGLWFTSEQSDAPGRGVTGCTVRVTRSKALKLAWAIIDELT